MAKEDIEKYDEETLDTELTKEQLELLEIGKEQSVKTRNGQVEFNSVNHSERAEKFGRVSDGDTTKYVNIALEYFGHRCALSGERFTKFDGKVQKTSAKSNLSAEHVVALCLGGDDIVPNLVPTVLQYNLRKNGYYLLDYWDKQKDTQGKSLYSPYRLLKLVNYMMKSIEARDLKSIKEYRNVIMTPNEIDEFLAEIEKQDELESDNTKKKIRSDTITATTADEDNKKILTEVPQVEGNIPTQREQLERFRQNEIDMMDIFLSDAVGLLNRTQELQQIRLKDKDGNEISLQDKLNDMLKSTIGVIPFEVEVRNAILEKLEALGIKDNKYSVANDLLNNTPILEMAKENRENVNDIVEEFLERRVLDLDLGITNEKKILLISSNPALLYDRREIEETKTNIERYIRYIGENINFEILNKAYLKKVLKIKEWMEKNNTTKPPRWQNENRTIPEEDVKLAWDLNHIKQDLIKPYINLKTEEEKEGYKRKHPELEEVIRIVEEIEKNNIKTKEDSAHYWNVLAIKKWMEKNKTTKPPRRQNKKRTVPEEEAKLARSLSYIKQDLIKPYINLKTEEEKEQYRQEHPGLEEVIRIVEEIEKNNIKTKEDSAHYWNALAIKEWMEKNNTTKPPRSQDADKTVPEEEAKLREDLRTIKRRLIKPYIYLKTEEKEEYKQEHPELEEVMKIVEEIEKNNIRTKEDSRYYWNALAIKEWMEKNNTTKPPRGQNITVPEEEAKLGEALSNIKQILIKPYINLKTEEEKEEYKQEHPELEEVMRIVEEIEKNNVPIYLENALAIKEWMKKNNTTKPPRAQNKNKTVPEKEAKLGEALSRIKQMLIKPYENKKTEEEKEEYKRKHPELEEVIRIVEEIEKNNTPIYLENALAIKEWMKNNNTKKQPKQQNKSKTVPEEEATLGAALNRIKQKLIKPYINLETEEEKEQYKQEHPELEEVMEIVQWIEAQKSTQKKVKQAVVEQKNKGQLGQNQQIEENIFEETIRQAEQVVESEVSAR